MCHVRRPRKLTSVVSKQQMKRRARDIANIRKVYTCFTKPSFMHYAIECTIDRQNAKEILTLTENDPHGQILQMCLGLKRQMHSVFGDTSVLLCIVLYESQYLL
jgi:hypothetical protein